MRVLVTGASGFSGPYLIAALIGRGHEVVAMTGRRQASVPADRTNLRFIAGDLAGAAPLPQEIDAIIHAAARSPAPGVTAADMVRDNALATCRLANHAMESGAKTLIYFSSLSVYGEIAVPVVDETTPIRVPDVYGGTKLLGEAIVRDQLTGCRSLALRLPGILGRGSVRNWLTAVVATARADEPIRIFNPDAKFNNAVHAEHLADFVVALIEKGDWSGHDVLTLGAGGATTIRTAAETVVAGLGSSSKILPVASGRASFMISSAKAVESYGYRPTQIEDMLLKFAGENRTSPGLPGDPIPERMGRFSG